MQNRKRQWSPISFLKGAAGYFFCRKIRRFEKFLVIVIALAYLLMPLDFIPDAFIPFGFLDDFGVWTLLLAYMSHRLNKKKEAEENITANNWEQKQ